jgi:excinuclease ABC subunit B
MYGDTITRSMQSAIDETQRRRKIQLEYNKTHNITPVSIKKSIQESLMGLEKSSMAPLVQEEEEDYLPEGNVAGLVAKLDKQMNAAAKALEFERAAQLRDRIKRLREKDLGIT